MNVQSIEMIVNKFIRAIVNHNINHMYIHDRKLTAKSDENKVVSMNHIKYLFYNT